jgi:hypothetical protein
MNLDVTIVQCGNVHDVYGFMRKEAFNFAAEAAANRG